MKIIDKRLNSIINEIDGHILVDVGCDHGKVTCQALLEKKVDKAIAVDISNKSLQKCQNLAKKLHLDNIEFRCSDGLEAIAKDEQDTVVIAGMGGYEIIKILSKNKYDINKLILCPHQDVEKLRDYLKDNYSIEKDYCVYQDDHFYSIIVAHQGKGILSRKELLLGKDSLANKDYLGYLEMLKDKYERIKLNPIPQARLEECNEVLKIIEDELNGSKENL